jgi:hypothetical protein
VRKAEPGTIKEKQAQMLRGKPARTGEREQECEEQGVLGRQFNSHESNCSAGNVNSKQQRVSQIVDEIRPLRLPPYTPSATMGKQRIKPNYRRRVLPAGK